MTIIPSVANNQSVTIKKVQTQQNILKMLSGLILNEKLYFGIKHVWVKSHIVIPGNELVDWEMNKTLSKTTA